MRRTSQELTAELAALNAEREMLAARIAADQKRLRVLDGNGWSVHGLIVDAATELKKARLWEEDDRRMRVTVVDSYQVGDPTRVVRKVTAKRIYLAVQGSEVEVYYDRETGKSSYGGAIHPDDLKRILEAQ